MKYTAHSTERPGLFAVKDENGKLIAETFDRDISEQIAALPEMIEVLKDGLASSDVSHRTKCTVLVKKLGL